MAELKLNDLRRYAISTRTIIRYADAQGRVAVLNQKGVIEIPGIGGPPPYNVEEVFVQAVEFRLEPWSSSYGHSRVKAPTTLTPEQMAEEVQKTLPASAKMVREEE
jgi:hypothetical protein